MYETILLPTDGQEGSTAAVAEAIDLARLCGATVHVVYVVDLDELGGYFSAGGLPKEFVDQALDEGEQRVERVADRFREADVAVETHVLKGRPEQELVEYVTEHGIDLVVMETAGRRGLRRVLLGSVTEEVVRLADCPVHTVKADGAAEETAATDTEAADVADDPDVAGDPDGA